MRKEWIGNVSRAGQNGRHIDAFNDIESTSICG
jgi:hypothetical protein